MKGYLKYAGTGLIGFVLATILWIYLGARDQDRHLITRDFHSARMTMQDLKLLRDGEVEACIRDMERELDDYIRDVFRENAKDNDYGNVESKVGAKPQYVRETLKMLYEYRQQYPHPLPDDLTRVDGSPVPREKRRLIDADAMLKKANESLGKGDKRE